jgi:hypothetical protein
MKIVVAHQSTRENAIRVLDRASDKLLGGGIRNVEIVDRRKAWEGPVMTFSFTGKLGYISVPLAGTLAVDDMNVTLESELPPLVKNFLGEERFRTLMEDNIKTLLGPADDPVI